MTKAQTPLPDALPSWAAQSDEGWIVHVKAVPGSSRNRIQGPLGDHLKIQVAAPPEGGKANGAIRALLAEHFGTTENAVVLTAGASNPRKTFKIARGRFPKLA